MSPHSSSEGSRRQLIADCGIRILARDGARALTHRAVDREAGIAQGSSSYYAPTRHALLSLIVETLMDRSMTDVVRAAEQDAADDVAGAPVSIDAAARSMTALLETLAARHDDMRARYTLLLELDADDPLRVALGTRTPVQEAMLCHVTASLTRLGVRSPQQRAIELFDLTDALLARRVIADAESAIEPVIAAYLRGITAPS